MKKCLLILLSLLFVVVLLPKIGHADAEVPVSLYLNDHKLDAPVSPQLIGAGTTMVPARLIAEAVGSIVSWTDNNAPIEVKRGNMQIELKLGQTQASVNGKSYSLEEAPYLLQNTTMLPIRFLAEEFGLTVGWDQANHAVRISQKQTPETALEAPSASMDSASTTKTGEDASTQPKPSPTPSPTPVPSSTPVPSPTPEPTTTPSPTPKLTSTPAGTPAPSASPMTQIPAPTSSNPVVTTSGNTTTPMTATPTPPPYNGKNPEVWSIGVSAAGLSIRTTAPVVPHLFTLANPDRLVIDLPGTSLTPTLLIGSTTQSGEMTVNDPNISRVRYSLYNNNPLTTRIVVDLKTKIDYNLIDSHNPLELLFSSASVKSTTGKTYKVVIDAGHGGHDSGALSVHGLQEKDFTLALATKVVQLLQKEPLITPIMTRKDDTFIALDDRVAIANNQQADLFLSIHGNKYDKPTVDGTETYYERPESEAFADALHKQILAATGFSDRGVRTADYRVITKTTMPAILCEIGFLSNPDNEASMYKTDFQDKVAASIVQGIKSYLQIK